MVGTAPFRAGFKRSIWAGTCDRCAGRGAHRCDVRLTARVPDCSTGAVAACDCERVTMTCFEPGLISPTGSLLPGSVITARDPESSAFAVLFWSDIPVFLPALFQLRRPLTFRSPIFSVAAVASSFSPHACGRGCVGRWVKHPACRLKRKAHLVTLCGWAVCDGWFWREGLAVRPDHVGRSQLFSSK